MTDRHLAALSLLTHGAPSGGYFDQHTTSATTASHYQQQQQHQQALQQRLLYQQQQQQRYHAAAYQQHHPHSLAGFVNPYASHSSAYSHLPVRDSLAINSYLGHQQNQPGMHASHFDGTYHGRLMGGSSGVSAAEEMLAHNRARFSPYHHHQQQHHSGMYTAAGQQLMPSSVLHYPPRPSAYEAMQQKQQAQQQLNLGIYEQQQQQQQQQRAYLHNLNGTQLGHTLSAYNPYSISQHHYQQSQLSLLSSQQQQQSRCATPAANTKNMSNHTQCLQPAELPTTTTTTSTANSITSSSCKAAAVNNEDINALGSSNNHTNSDATAAASHFQLQQQQQQSFVNCITTSPPLISACGTDSGISSSGCSIRGGTRSSDSTQSTPVYSSEYPMSVGSSSGVSYHYADSISREPETRDGKDTNDSEQVMAAGNEEEVQPYDDIKKELHENESENHCQVKQEPVDDGFGETKTEDLNTMQTHQNHYNNNYSSTNLNISSHNSRQQMQCTAVTTSTTSASTSCIPKYSSPRCTTPFLQASTPYASQHTQEPPTQQQMYTNSKNNSNLNSSWSPFPSSPNNWIHRSSPTYDSPTRAQNSPPMVPVPPHNSPVDYHPTASLPTIPFAVVVPPNKKNRTKECDLMLSKKSRRKAIDIKVEQQDEFCGDTRRMTPLPGFQQAFGSTEIGRFSETFPATSDGVFEQYASYEENPQQSQDYFTSSDYGEHYGTAQQSWTTNESYLDQANRVGMQYNMRYGGGQHNFGSGYRAGTSHYGLQESMMMSRSKGSFSEIRCNGY